MPVHALRTFALTLAVALVGACAETAPVDPAPAESAPVDPVQLDAAQVDAAPSPEPAPTEQPAEIGACPSAAPLAGGDCEPPENDAGQITLPAPDCEYDTGRTRCRCDVVEGPVTDAPARWQWRCDLCPSTRPAAATPCDLPQVKQAACAYDGVMCGCTTRW